MPPCASKTQSNTVQVYLYHIKYAIVSLHTSSSSDIPTEQARPNGSSWHKWRLLLDLIASSDTHLLHLPLGSWLQGGDSLRRQWTSYYDPVTRCLYRRIQDKFLRYEQMDSRFINGVLETWTPSSTSFPVSPLLMASDIWTIPQLEQTYLSTASLHHASPTSSPSTAPDFYTFIRQETGPYDYLKENIHMFLEPNEIFHLVETESADDLNSDPPYHLILCSDGSDLIPLMSYGWIFATSLGTKLAQGNGPAFGFHSSHRAEGTGMLSGAVFIQLLLRYLEASLTCPLYYYCDNKGLITRMTLRSQYSDNYPNATLASDWDLVEEIHHITSSLPSFFRHVKGHQDSTSKADTLDLPAQLNITADKLAGEYYDDHDPDPDPHDFELLHHTRAHLQIRSQTITSHYLSHIYYFASIDTFYAALQANNKWNATTFSLIDLDGLKRSVRSYCHRKLFLFKFQHGLLPTQEHKAQWEPCSNLCPLCLQPDTQSHFLQCSHSHLAKPRKEAFQAFNKTLLAIDTDFETQTVILAYLEKFFNPSKPHQIQIPDSLASSIQEQEQIGWHSFLRGFWSKSWSIRQHDFYRRRQLLDHYTSGQAWQTKISRALFDLVYEIWTVHNSYVHGHTTKRISKDHRIRIINRIRHLHSYRPLVMHAHRDSLFMSNPAQTLQQSTTPFLQNWLLQYESSILASLNSARLSALKNTPSIYTFFHTTKAPSKGRPKPFLDGKFRTKFDTHCKKKRNRNKPMSRYRRFIPHYFQRRRSITRLHR